MLKAPGIPRDPTRRFRSETSGVLWHSDCSCFSWHTLLKDDVDTTNDSRQINGTVDTVTTRQSAIESARPVKGIRRAVSSLRVQV
jgi:hypothetical protein